MKQIVTEIWKMSGEKAFGGKDLIEIVNRQTGKTETYQKIREVTNPNIVAYPEAPEDSIDTEDYYGGNGYQRVRFAEAVIAEQTEIPTDFDRD